MLPITIPISAHTKLYSEPNACHVPFNQFFAMICNYHQFKQTTGILNPSIENNTLMNISWLPLCGTEREEKLKAICDLKPLY